MGGWALLYWAVVNRLALPRSSLYNNDSIHVYTVVIIFEGYIIVDFVVSKIYAQELNFVQSTKILPPSKISLYTVAGYSFIKTSRLT